jgi:hypothetical protein
MPSNLSQTTRRARASDAAEPSFAASDDVGKDTETSSERPEGAPNPHDSQTRMQTARSRIPQNASASVTLIVYGWSNVEPGTLAWTFPSLNAARNAAHKMRNATEWAIVAGAHANEATRPINVDEARAAGAVLMETLPTNWLRIG